MPLDIEPDEAREIFRSSGALGIRYVTAREDRGRASWQMSASGARYSLEDFSGNTRSKIRRGIKHHEIRRVTGEELARVGEQAFLDTVERQGRAGRYGPERWRRLLAAADRTPGIEIWSTWHDGTLTAYLLVMVFVDTCELYEARSRNDALRHYPNNALIYTITEDMLARRGLREVTFGVEGLEDLDTLDQFKLAMGFVQKPIRQHVIFHPALRTALSLRPVRGVVEALAERRNSSSFWRRARSLVDFAGFGS
jgi:hypothetical protein